MCNCVISGTLFCFKGGAQMACRPYFHKWFNSFLNMFSKEFWAVFQDVIFNTWSGLSGIFWLEDSLWHRAMWWYNLRSTLLFSRVVPHMTCRFYLHSLLNLFWTWGRVFQKCTKSTKNRLSFYENLLLLVQHNFVQITNSLNQERGFGGPIRFPNFSRNPNVQKIAFLFLLLWV